MLAFSLYLLLGPLLWLLLAFGTLLSRARFAKLRNSNPQLPQAAPEVAVLVPAHNEGPGVRACLRSILDLDYAPLRVVAVDDRSTDHTLAEMRDLAATDPRLTVLHVDHKPPDWLGKCHALHVASQHPDARAPWLLLIDSDVKVRPESLRKCMAMALYRNIDALSLLTRQRCESFAEKLLTPFACGMVIGMYLGSWTNEENRRSSAFANGQFFLIRRQVYDRVGGHHTVRAMPTEDVDLMRTIKRSGGKCRLYAGEHLAETRMYDSLGRMFGGWARIYSGASHRRPWRILAASVVLLSGLSAFVLPWLLPGAGPLWAVALSLHLTLVIGVFAFVYHWSGNSPVLALLYPLAAVMQLAFFGKALWWCLTNRMSWRGTAYAAPPGPPPPGGPPPGLASPDPPAQAASPSPGTSPPG